MNTTNQVLKALEISYLNYDNYREACFQNWIKKYAREYAISIRAMITHDGLRNWYHDQWQLMVEKPFVKENQAYFDLDAADVMQDVFFSLPERIEGIYPITLLKMIKSEENGIIELPRIKGTSNYAN